jgi:CBS domain-containing protein
MEHRDMTMIKAADLMTRKLVSVTADTPLAEVAKLVLERRITALPVLDDGGRLIGMVSESDLVRCSADDHGADRAWWLTLLTSPGRVRRDDLTTDGRKVSDVMSKDVLMVREDEPLPHLIELLAKSNIKRLSVVRDGRLTGMVSRVDVLRHLAITYAKNGQLPH